MLTDADLPPLRADQTYWHALRGVHLRKSPKPVELELRWLHSSEYMQARRRLAMSAITGDALTDAETQLIARYLVVGWRNVPDGNGGQEPFAIDGCAKLLAHVRAQAPDLWLSFDVALVTPENFGRVPLVDPETLGNA
ncbi:MAG: hypothetical protein M3R55_10265 [Acidobacteriota bacterium]|nr:hypothetical protein [Acidobacteriota bacterium]